MKKLDKYFIKKMNLVLAGLLSLLGFSGCGDENTMVEEYGTLPMPYADFIVSGKVVNEMGKPLDNVCVVVSEVESIDRSFGCCSPDSYVYTYTIGDTIFSSSEGIFDYKIQIMPNDTINIKMLFEDVSANSIYESDSMKVAFPESELVGKDGLYEGSLTKEVTIKLKAKK